MHLILAMVAGIVIFLQCITGFLYVFERELQDYFKQDSRLVRAENRVILPPSKLFENTFEALGTNFLPSRLSYRGSGYAISVWMEREHPKASYQVFLNPYTGQVLKIENTSTDFFALVKRIHQNLLLPRPYGKLIIQYSTLVFGLLILTGLYLWLPKRFQIKHFTLKKGSSAKRLNYDLHRIIGLYTFLPALIILLTGWAISSKPVSKFFQKTLFTTAPAEKKPLISCKPTDTTNLFALKNKVIDEIINQLDSEKAYSFRLPRPAKALVLTCVNAGKKRSESSFYHYDQYTGQLLAQDLYPNNAGGSNFRFWIYDLHTGGLFGLTGKFIAAIAVLLSASLPVTGFIIWLNRRKKAGKFKQKSHDKPFQKHK